MNWSGRNSPDKTRAPFLALLLFAFLAAGAGASGSEEPNLPSARERWLRVETPNFTLYGNTSEGKIRDVGLELERFRAVLLLLTQKLTANAPVPTLVYVFKSDASLEPYKPLFGGKPRSLAAYFLPSEDGNFIALTAGSNSDPSRSVYHEYLHFFLRNNFKPQPAWYDEGLAEFYSTFRATDTEARIGLPIEEHVALLREIGLMPLERLFAVDQDSPEYNEQSRQGQFYAQSWALVHYLMRGPEQRKEQLGKFLVALQNGRKVDEAFRSIFQTDYRSLLSEVVRYVSGDRFFYMVTKFAELKVPKEAKTSPMSREETLVRLGDLLARVSPESVGGAEAHFRAVLATDPTHAEALAGMGMLRMRQEKDDEAAEFLRRAMDAGAADFRVPFHYGALCMRAFHNRPMPVGGVEEIDRRQLEEARRAFLKSVERNPNFPEARAALGRTYLVEEAPVAAEGIPHLELAVKFLPGRDDLALALASLYERTGQDAKAEALMKTALGPHADRIIEQKRKTAGFERSLERVNELLEERKESEALALLEQLAAESPEDVRAALDEQLTTLREGVARNLVARKFNEAIARLGKQDYEGALAGFLEVAATARDPALAKRARDEAESTRQYLASRKRAPPKKGR